MSAISDPAGSGIDPEQAAARRKMIIGWAAASTVVCVWSSWLVLTRYGALSPLTPFDLAALRFGVSSVIALPFVLYFKPWRTLTLRRGIVLTLLLSPVYVLLAFGGFKFAPAAHGGVFMNGLLPVLTLGVGWLWLRERATVKQLGAAGLILAGTVLVATDKSHMAFSETWPGDLLFIASTILLAAYLVVTRLWQVSTSQVLMCSAVLNAIFYLPIWYLFLPSAMAETSQHQIVIQALYQGIFPSLLGLLLLTAAVRNIGSSAASAAMAAVPGLGAVLSLIIPGRGARIVELDGAGRVDDWDFDAWHCTSRWRRRCKRPVNRDQTASEIRESCVSRTRPLAMPTAAVTPSMTGRPN